MTRLELGVTLRHADPRLIVERARLAERLGFASITVADHLGTMSPAPLTACAALAFATDRARIGPLVLNNDFRHPVVLAREAVALAELSDGRFELGIGAGHMRAEYERAGIPYDPGVRRIARMTEAAEILRSLLAGDTVDFAGAHYTVRGERTSERAHPPIPILIGGNAPAILDAAARHADIVGLTGFSARAGGTDATIDDFVARALDRQIAHIRVAAGTRASGLRFQALVQAFEVTRSRAAAIRRLAAAIEVPEAAAADSPYVLAGSAAEIADQLRTAHARHGITRWTVFDDPDRLPPFETLAPVIEALG